MAGTSLNVNPFADTRHYCAPLAPRLLINLERVGAVDEMREERMRQVATLARMNGLPMLQPHILESIGMPHGGGIGGIGVYRGV